jgi:hypothetical protein
VDLGNGWGLPEPLQRKLRLLEHLADNSRGSTIANVPDWVGQPGTPEHADVVSDFEEFDARGWLNSFGRSGGGGVHAQLAGAGYAVVEEVRIRRQDRQLRHDAVLDALLAWLYDRHLDDVDSPPTSDFTASRFGQFYSDPFTDAEIVRGTRQLAEDGYITGTGAWGAGIPRPRITSKGIQTARARRSVNDDHPIPSPTIVTITGDHNTVQSGSPGAAQHVTTTITDDHRRQAVELAATVDQAAALLGPDAVADAHALRCAVATGQHEPGVVRAALQRLQTTLLTGSTDLVGKAILGGATGLLAHYGIPT